MLLTNMQVSCPWMLSFEPFCLMVCTNRREGQDTQDELQMRNLQEELEDRERRHFSSKDKYSCMISFPYFFYFY